MAGAGASEFLDKKGESNTQLLQELEALSHTLYQNHTRRTASLALPRNAVPSPAALSAQVDQVPDRGRINADYKTAAAANKPRARRMSLSPWRSRQKQEDDNHEEDLTAVARGGSGNPDELRLFEESVSGSGKKGIWSWKPMRALSHIGMQKLSCLFSVDVVSVQGLPASMNGLRLSVCVKKKETKDGAVNTMPARVSHGAADFEETLFIRCHVYGTPGSGNQLKFEPRPFLIYVFAVDTDEIDFGKSSVDLSRLIHESIAKSTQGARIRQWDTSFSLAGKAKGAELVLKLGFQIMEKDGNAVIYSQASELRDAKASSSAARKQSKTSFSIPSPKITSKTEVWTPSQPGTTAADIQVIDHLNLDEPTTDGSPPAVQKWKEQESKIEELDLPEFEVVDKGVEIQENVEEVVEEKEVTVKTEVKTRSNEDVKEMVQDQFHLTRMTELDSIAQQIKALETMMGDENSTKTDETESQRLDDEEDAVTREFLQQLEDEEETGSQDDLYRLSSLKEEGSDEKLDEKSNVFLPDLGKGLGSVVQTRNGGYLAAMNPSDLPMARKDTPKLAMQLSKPFVLTSYRSMSGFELFQRIAAIGLEELSTEIVSLMPIEEIMGKTAEQVAFEGIASAIISGRNKEGASSSAARTITAVKTMATAMSMGRSERITTGIWNLSEDPLTVEEILAFAMQKIEVMSIDALKIQAEMSEEDAPFDVSPLAGRILAEGGKDRSDPLASATPLEDWIKSNDANTSDEEHDDSATVTIALLVQLRDPLRRYEAVGGPVIALIQATEATVNTVNEYSDEKKFKLMSLHIGGMKVQTGLKKNVWDTEKQRLTAMQWLVAYGFGKAGRKVKAAQKGQDLLWSLSTRVMADMWLTSIRNPDVKFAK